MRIVTKKKEGDICYIDPSPREKGRGGMGGTGKGDGGFYTLSK